MGTTHWRRTIETLQPFSLAVRSMASSSMTGQLIVRHLLSDLVFVLIVVIELHDTYFVVCKPK